MHKPIRAAPTLKWAWRCAQCANTYGSALFSAGGGLANVNWKCNTPNCSNRSYNVQARARPSAYLHFLFIRQQQPLRQWWSACCAQSKAQDIEREGKAGVHHVKHMRSCSGKRGAHKSVRAT